MACDARQALDLLEIVQQPDAVILDLAVEGAVTLALAARLYRENPSTGLQIFLLAPEKSRLPEFRADTAWAEVLRPFGIPDLQRLIAPWARLP
jgi:CheY-like chemotaxis protein